MREIKFRYVLRYLESKEIFYKWYYINQIEDGLKNLFDTKFCELISRDQFTGLHDKNGKEWYIDDIGQFDNGDKFIIRMNDWLEMYIEWIGEPECEDQARDNYRIERAVYIGNIHENPEC